MDADIEEIGIALKGEEAMQEYCKAERPGILALDAKQLTETMASLFPEVDRKTLLENQTMGQGVVDSLREALKTGSDGRVDDMLAFVQPWGFELGEIRVPVLLYHGSEDRSVPFGHGQWLAVHLPQDQVQPHLLQGEGHMSIFLRRMDEMLDEVLAVVAQAQEVRQG